MVSEFLSFSPSNSAYFAGCKGKKAAPKQAEKVVVDKKGGWKPFYKDESGTPLNINLKSIFTTTISTYAVTAGGFRLFKLAKARMNKTMPGQLL